MEHFSVYFVSLGCPKNLVDSQVMLGLLEKDRYFLSSDPSCADVIIVNTCSFIEASKKESIDTLLEMIDYKQTGQCKVLVASGCLVQRYTDTLEKDFPEIDLFIGTGQYHRITELLSKRAEAVKSGGALPERAYVDQPAFIHTENHTRAWTGPRYTAYLKLSEGCNRRCAFCIIPKLRGNVRSRTVASLVQEATQLAQQGVVELNLIAQDLTEYGMEWKYRERLETLLPELCKIEGIRWIRLHYVYPDQFSEELIGIIASEPKIVKYIDMPIQHTQDRILTLMNRKLRKKHLFNLIEKLRERIPGIVFRTSIIVGFPGETEDDFLELCRDLSALCLDYVGVFKYSQEEGTPAASFENQVDFTIKEKRHSKLMKQLEKQAHQNQKKYLGSFASVLIEGVSEESELLFQGRMSTQAQEIDGHVLINDVKEGISLSAGDLVTVQITEVLSHDLVGRVLV